MFRIFMFNGGAMERSGLVVWAEVCGRVSSPMVTGVPPACRRPGSFSRSPEKTEPKEGRPALAPTGSSSRRVRARLRGFADRASCPGVELVGIPADHPAGLVLRRAPLHDGR
jgi:hypothetical protein